MTAFLINLDRHPDRLTAAQDRLSQAGVRAERVSAVDGIALSPSARRAAVARFRALLARGRLYTPGQIGCALSHHAIYRRMVAEGIPAALILEDDVLPLPGFPASLAAAEKTVDASRPFPLIYNRQLNLCVSPLHASSCASTLQWSCRSTAGPVSPHAGTSNFTAPPPPLPHRIMPSIP